MSSRFVSESDFVTSHLLPKPKEASGLIEVGGLPEFHVNKQVEIMAFDYQRHADWAENLLSPTQGGC